MHKESRVLIENCYISYWYYKTFNDKNYLCISEYTGAIKMYRKLISNYTLYMITWNKYFWTAMLKQFYKGNMTFVLMRNSVAQRAIFGHNIINYIYFI